MGMGEYWTENNAVCVVVGKRAYRITGVSEIRGYMTTVVTSKTAVMRIRYNGHTLKLHSSPMSGASDFGGSGLYHLFETIKASSPNLKPQQDMLGAEIEYFYRSSSRRK